MSAQIEDFMDSFRCELVGFWGNWRMKPLKRRVELLLSQERSAYEFRFYKEESSEVLTIKGSLNDLMQGVVYFVWLADIFLHIEDAIEYRRGRFGTQLAVAWDIDNVCLFVHPVLHHPYRRICCVFFVALGDQAPDSPYCRFEIIVPLDSAKVFGQCLWDYLRRIADMR